LPLKYAIRTIKDLRWTVESFDEDSIFYDLTDDLKCDLQKLVILIKENLKKYRENTGNMNDIGRTELALEQIKEIIMIASILDFKL
jgi:hypothetical protein